MSSTDSSSEISEKPQRSRARNWWRSLLGHTGDANSLRESLEEMIVEHDEPGRNLTDQERHMLANILSFGELRVDDVMVPRVDVVALEESATLDEVLSVFRASNHSRWPIYRETLDDPLGMVHIKDIVSYLISEPAEKRPPFALKSLKREVLFVPPSMPALDLLVKMQTTRVHLALVIDEYGGTDGLVSIEDLMEEIVGDIEDEHDEEEGPDFIEHADGSIDANARAPIEDLEKLLGQTLVAEDSEDNVETLAGLVFSLAGRVPVRGELIKHPSGVEFEVRDADPRRIKKLRIHRSPEPAQDVAVGASGK